ncbi:hypothetical protein RS130_09885 [Paraglaciecola aquimarina]|uniref:Glycosyl hydrolases family 2 sugar binding domain-containing protein n=1 Tax=Paraglaciecola aquimarina TaxID=1235557 RepID=A0ABU3SW37_9ALTE|nr:sugar-binding domain-containing protein [Paraglaciecola aquimarina]MDU0354203.1 hypothetical protein [Paraglaciecola aquimarina]
MKFTAAINTTLLVICLLASPVVLAYKRGISLDFNWKFHLGDVSGAQARGFNDQDWRILDLPHDFSIEGEYDKNNPAGWSGGYLPTGIGWYRKHLSVPQKWQGKRLILRFDGVYLNSDVWVNGQHVGHRPNGYVSFSYDITPYLQGPYGGATLKALILLCELIIA